MSMIDGAPKPLGRFAPSPTGEMHAGNIFAALVAWLEVKSHGGRMLLRLEDLDRQRSKADHGDRMMRDLEELGLAWDIGPVYQSQRDDAYEEAFASLQAQGLIYPCFCTRSDLHAASAPQGECGPVYRGTCRALSDEEIIEKTASLARQGRLPSFRVAVPDEVITFHDGFMGQHFFHLCQHCGDFIVCRSDGGWAYQLAVVVDDAAFNVTSVVRGCDLVPSTPQQIFLQRKLGFAEPRYGHIPLFCAEDGRRLAKRDKACAYGALKARFGSPAAVLGHIAFVGGLQERDEPTTVEELLALYDPDGLAQRWDGVTSLRFR